MRNNQSRQKLLIPIDPGKGSWTEGWSKITFKDGWLLGPALAPLDQSSYRSVNKKDGAHHHRGISNRIKWGTHEMLSISMRNKQNMKNLLRSIDASKANWAERDKKLPWRMDGWMLSARLALICIELVQVNGRPYPRQKVRCRRSIDASKARWAEGSEITFKDAWMDVGYWWLVKGSQWHGTLYIKAKLLLSVLRSIYNILRVLNSTWSTNPSTCSHDARCALFGCDRQRHVNEDELH
jgi:hypothetical protein